MSTMTGSIAWPIREPLCLRRPMLRPLCLRARATQAIVERVLDSLPVRAVYPDGTVRGGGGAQSPTLELVDPAALFDRMGHHPKIGLGEAYMAGDWRAVEGTDLAQLLTPFAERMSTVLPTSLLRLRGVVDRPLPQWQRNTPSGSRNNISAHYDLSNDLFARFLDETMTYSSALFDNSTPFAEQVLEDAQRRKLEAVLDAAGVVAGTRVLEIGTGWGSLTIAAARRGAWVTSATISQKQLDLARTRVAEAGLQGHVDLRLQDYRDVPGHYDAIVSVEMVEAVGEEFWPAYFATLDRLLAPGGRIGMQTILMDHHRMLATRNSFGWIQKYIFPGGLIPSLPAIEGTLGAHTGLRVSGQRRFGPHYAETLRRWRSTFVERWPEIRHLGFDDTFRRMWEFYLAYSEAGFASGYLDVAQLQLVKRTG
jgi:cyclopropane-fatty-acyl-phospholipid synthase